MIRTRRLGVGVAEESSAVADPRVPRVSWPAFAVPADHRFILRDILWHFPTLAGGASMEMWLLLSGGPSLLIAHLASDPAATTWSHHSQADIVFEGGDELWLFSVQTPFSFCLSGASLPPL